MRKIFGFFDEQGRFHPIRDDGRPDGDWLPNEPERAFAEGLGIEFTALPPPAS
jgi:hypothetical protein